MRLQFWEAGPACPLGTLARAKGTCGAHSAAVLGLFPCTTKVQFTFVDVCYLIGDSLDHFYNSIMSPDSIRGIGNRLSRRSEMKLERRIWRQSLALALLVGSLLAVAATMGCSGNRSVRVGAGLHRDSSGNWGHSISVGVQSHGRRR